jgi:hypothetical protein
MIAVADGGPGIGHAAPRLDPEYYEQWRKEQAEAIARGEDPYADFARRAREASDNTALGKMSNGLKSLFKKGKKEEKKKGEEGGTGKEDGK